MDSITLSLLFSGVAAVGSMVAAAPVLCRGYRQTLAWQRGGPRFCRHCSHEDPVHRQTTANINAVDCERCDCRVGASGTISADWANVRIAIEETYTRRTPSGMWWWVKWKFRSMRTKQRGTRFDPTE